MATEHLLALGHRRIAFVGDEESNPFGSTRAPAGARASRRRLSPPACRSSRGLVKRRPHGRKPAREAAAALLAYDSPPTAVFAGSDVQALGVLTRRGPRECRAEGLSVIGFDDIEAAAYTGLTTVAQPLEQIGSLGAELLLRVLAGERVSSRRIPLAIVERGTTTAPSWRRTSCEGTRTRESRSDIPRRRVRR
jgi:DNA-binding LacI/PurR family transcriptional regulator